MKVTVVVPVYNPGTAIGRCIDSITRQTMPADEFEVVFVDDGSTDETPARLDALAAERSNVRVIHEENSGWAGKPRNVGVDAARGDYVQFLDQDDMLGPDALRRLHEMATRNGSDIVLGKVVSDFRGVPHGVFRHNVERCTIRDFPLVQSLTPHKMFRRAFLDEHGIRYPEGRRRLEDQVYMMRAYLVADVVSVVGDYPCYYYLRRDDGGNAGSESIDPKGYYTNLREVLDVVEAGTEPGEFRNALFRRFYRGELLGRLAEPAMLDWDADYRRQLFDEVRSVVTERFDDDVTAGLPLITRGRATLLVGDQCDAMVDFARRCADVVVHATVREAEWIDGKLRLDVRAELGFRDGSPLLVDPAAGRILDPQLGIGVGDGDPVALARDLDSASGEVFVRERSKYLRWVVAGPLSVGLERHDGDPAGGHRVALTTSALLEPARLAGGRRLGRGTWDIYVAMDAFGLFRNRRLPAVAAADPPPPAILGRRPLVAIPLITDHGNLTLDVDEHVRWLAGEVETRGGVAEAVEAVNEEIQVPLPVVATGGEPWPAQVTLVTGSVTESVSCTFPAEVRRRSGRAVVTAGVGRLATSPVARLRPGRYDLLLHTGTRGLPPRPVGQVVLPEPTVRRRVGRWLDDVEAEGPAPLRGIVGAVRRQLPR